MSKDMSLTFESKIDPFFQFYKMWQNLCPNIVKESLIINSGQ
jgi:hypothetical protein